MARVLIDVATIRTSSIILHSAQPADRTDRDADLRVATVGQLLEAIVLFDEIVIPDLGHRSSIDDLTRPFGPVVRRLPIAKESVSDIEDSARTWMSEFCQIADLIRLMGLVPTYRYSGTGSKDFAVLAALGMRDKYSSDVAEYIRALRSYSFSRTSRDSRDSLFQPSRGTPYYPASEKLRAALEDLRLPNWNFDETGAARVDRSTIQGSDELVEFCANLAWLTFRSRCYDQLSQQLDISYMPHALRARIVGFAATTDEADVPNDSSKHRLASRYIRIIEDVYKSAHRAVGEQVGGAYIMPLGCSMLLPYLARRAKRKANIVDAAYDLRETRGAVNLRKRAADVEHALKDGDLRTALSYVKELHGLTRSLQRTLGLDAGPKINMAVSIPGIVQLQAPIQLPRPTGKIVRRFKVGKSRLILLRNVFDEVMAAASLGSVYDFLFDR